MKPWRIRYEQQQGLSMMIERDPPLGRDDLNELQLMMLQNCTIPGLIPVDTEELNGSLALRYSLSGMRRLSEVLRVTRWSMRALMQALSDVAETMEECRLFMLDSERLMFEDELIFTTTEKESLRFTYMPLKEMPPAQSLSNELERLVVRWMVAVADLDGTVIQQVLQIVSNPDFVPSRLRDYARKYLTDQLSYSVDDTRRANRMSISSGSSFEHVQAGEQTADWFAIEPVDDFGTALAAKHEAKESQLTASQLSRLRTCLLCAAALLAAVLWKSVYFREQDPQALWISGCVTLVLAAGVIYLWGGWPEWMRVQLKAVSAPLQREFAEDERQSPVSGQLRTFHIEKPAEYVEESIASAYSADLADDYTVYLSGSDERSVSYLIAQDESGERRIPLNESPFVIGRSVDSAHCVDESPGISRAHAELFKYGNEWKIRDLGSRNGSQLNDHALVPYETYPLSDGDCFVLAGSRYRFKQAAN